MLEILSNSYAALSLMVCVYLGFLLVKINKSRIEERNILRCTIFIALITVLSYVIFIEAEYYKTAFAAKTLYYICTDWLAFFVFNLAAFNATYLKKKKSKDILFFTLIVLDTISFIVNLFTGHSFDLDLFFTDSSGSYWGIIFTPFHYIHLGLCYVMVFSAFVVYLINIVKSPKFYKSKFVAFMVAYFAVIIANFISYSMNLPLDYSVVLYGIFAGYVSYYLLYTFSDTLIYNVLGAVSEESNDVIVSFDYRGFAIQKNKAAERFFNLKTGIIKSSAEDFLKKFLKKQTERMDIVYDGIELHLKLEYQELRFEDELVGSYIKISDKTQEVNQYLQERYNATHDELTGLYNRMGFFEEIERQIKNGIYQNPVMVVSNFRDFRLINEIFGVETGDQLLLRQAKMMKEKAHPRNINGRLNDDKFAIFMDKSDLNLDKLIASYEILKKVTEKSAYQLSMSIGIYEIKNAEENVQVMYDKAKLAMDSIRKDYATMFSFYDSTMMDKVLAEKNVVNDIEDAIANGHLEFYLQPAIREDGSINSAEALVRWNDPKRGLLLPSEFLGPLEKTGLLYKMDMYVIEQVVKKMAEWKESGKKLPRIAVNLSSRNKYYFDDVEFLRNITAKYDVSPKNIILEVQESALIDDYEEGFNLFEKLREIGFEISIDRFGSGFSSLNLLKDFNLDGIKISADFLSEDELSEKSMVILSSMISMARKLGMIVVALGVETEEHHKKLMELGCNRFQGFYFAKPMPVSEFEKKYLV